VGQEFSNVMAGLVPAIHAFLAYKDVYARRKAGHDKTPFLRWAAVSCDSS
jgi:hypothetical protein